MFDISTENFIVNCLLISSATALLIHNTPLTLCSSTFNQPFNLCGFLPPFHEYKPTCLLKLISIELDSSVSVLLLLKLNPNSTKMP